VKNTQFTEARAPDQSPTRMPLLTATRPHQVGRALFATGYWLRRDAMTWFWDQYTTDEQQRSESWASPLRASLSELTGLPPALVIVGEADVLRDEGEAYAAKLRSADVPVTAVRFQGIIHDFVMVNALRDTHAARAATAMGGEFLRGALHTGG